MPAIAPRSPIPDARFRVFVHQTPDAVFVYEAATKRILETNPAFRELLGYSALEAHSLTAGDILAPEAGPVTAFFGEFTQWPGAPRRERQWRRKDGALVEVEMTASAIPTEGQDLVFVLGRDITERKRAEARYRALLDEAPAMYVITQVREGVVCVADCNRTFLQTLGYASAEVIGRPLSDFYARTALLKDNLTAALASREHRLQARDGRVIPVLRRAAPELDWRGREVGERVMYVDLTADKLAEGALRAGSMLTTVTAQAANTDDFEATLQVLSDHLGRLLNADGSCLALWEEAQQTAALGAASGSLAEAYRQIRPEPGLRPLTAAVLAAGRTLVEEEVARSPHLEAVAAGQFPARSLLGLPLIVGERRLGAAFIVFNQPRRFKPEAVAAAEGATSAIALAVVKALLFRDLRAAHAALTEAYDATLEGLAVALELRDKETEGHTRRVAELTARLAAAVGLSAEMQAIIWRGAILHDIGKIGIPDEILRKPDTLTPDERFVMAKHPAYAYQIIAAIPFLHPAIDIPYCHHERWDGRGYPRGLRGEAIPLAARLFAVVDVWDALTSDRPYRARWPAAKALAHIQALAGAHFDPAVVAAFMQMLAETSAPPTTALG